MGDLCWEWSLSNGLRVRTSVDRDGVESVWVGRRLVSRSQRGGKPDGHVVPLPEPPAAAYRAPADGEVTVRFDQDAKACVLCVGAEPVAPTRAPDSPASRRLWILLTMVTIATLGMVAVVGGAVRRYAIARHARASALTKAYRSPDGLFVAHYPSAFVPSATSDRGRNATVTLGREGYEEVVILMSTAEPISTDVDELARAIYDGMKHDSIWGTFVESSRRRDVCLGEQGLVTEGELRVGVERGTVWSCVFLRGGRGYFFAYAVPTTRADTDGALLRSIVDATELVDGGPSPVVEDAPPAPKAARPVVPPPTWGRSPQVERRPPPHVAPKASPARPPVHHKPPPTPRPGRIDTVVCDANGACQGVGRLARPPSPGTVTGRRNR